MKTSELIALLQQRLETHGDLPVMVLAEGAFVRMQATQVYRSRDGVWCAGQPGPVLIVDDCDLTYKDDFAEDPREGE